MEKKTTQWETALSQLAIHINAVDFVPNAFNMTVKNFKWAFHMFQPQEQKKAQSNHWTSFRNPIIGITSSVYCPSIIDHLLDVHGLKHTDSIWNKEDAHRHIDIINTGKVLSPWKKLFQQLFSHKTE